MSNISNIVEHDFTKKVNSFTPLTNENTAYYHEIFDKTNPEYEKIRDATYTLIEVALRSQFDFRRKGDRAKINSFYENDVVIRQRKRLGERFAYIYVSEKEKFVFIRELKVGKTRMEPAPTLAEEAQWRAQYQI